MTCSLPCLLNVVLGILLAAIPDGTAVGANDHHGWVMRHDIEVAVWRQVATALLIQAAHKANGPGGNGADDEGVLQQASSVSAQDKLLVLHFYVTVLFAEKVAPCLLVRQHTTPTGLGVMALMMKRILHQAALCQHTACYACGPCG